MKFYVRLGEGLRSPLHRESLRMKRASLYLFTGEWATKPLPLLCRPPAKAHASAVPGPKPGGLSGPVPF